MSVVVEVVYVKKLNDDLISNKFRKSQMNKLLEKVKWFFHSSLILFFFTYYSISDKKQH